MRAFLRKPNHLFFLLSFIITLFFCIVIALDLFPVLRGPGPYPPHWKWEYLPVNTLHRLWLPILVASTITIVAYFTERKKEWSTVSLISILILCILLGIALQLSVLFYSRSGIGVLIHRIINPMISGYFTSSLSITSIGDFLKNYNAQFLQYPMYASFHPPFSVLIFTFFSLLVKPLTPFLEMITNYSPNHVDVASVWNSLTKEQRILAFFSGPFIAFLSQLTLIPLFLVVRHLYGVKIALRSIFLYLLIPSIILFQPLNDIFFPLFSCIALYFFITGEKRKFHYFLSGLSLSIGVLFSLTYLPIGLFFMIIGGMLLFRKKITMLGALSRALYFGVGFIMVYPILFLMFQYNFIETFIKIMEHHIAVEHNRDYFVGLFYAPFDFYLFLGIPITILVFTRIYRFFKDIRFSKSSTLLKQESVVTAYVIFLTAVILSGSVRLESARIWIPFIPLALIIASSEIKQRKITSQQFLSMLLLLFIQVILFQSILVTVW